jgi:hypothetical protein
VPACRLLALSQSHREYINASNNWKLKWNYLHMIVALNKNKDNKTKTKDEMNYDAAIID